MRVTEGLTRRVKRRHAAMVMVNRKVLKLSNTFIIPSSWRLLTGLYRDITSSSCYSKTLYFFPLSQSH